MNAYIENFARTGFITNTWAMRRGNRRCLELEGVDLDLFSRLSKCWTEKELVTLFNMKYRIVGYWSRKHPLEPNQDITVFLLRVE